MAKSGGKQKKKKKETKYINKYIRKIGADSLSVTFFFVCFCVVVVAFSGQSLCLDPFYELPCFFCLTFGTNIIVMSVSHFFPNWQLGHQSVLNGC